MSNNVEKIQALQKYMNSQILGQEALVKKLIIAILADGNVLVEGAPGLAKTKAIKTLSEVIDAKYKRIQFTPDLLPSDITGGDIYLAQKGEFEFREGPIFANLVLADEINRSPAKVQSALLEAMAERQVSVGGKSYKLPELFMVMATQNPIENEGTYNLPEAQLDRFTMHIKVSYPDIETERQVLNIVRKEAENSFSKNKKTRAEAISVEDIISAKKEVLGVYMSQEMEEYILQLIMATREPEKYDTKLKDYILYGASPRATIALDRCAKINAWMSGRDFVTPEDVFEIVYDVLRHRIILSFEATAEGLSTDDVIAKLISHVSLP